MRRKILAVAGALLVLCTAAATGSTAQAVDSTAIAVMSGVPTTSPAVTNGWIGAGTSIACEPGHACVAVPYGGGYQAFDFYRYGAYSVSNWTGSGYIFNNQSGGAAIRYDGADGRQLGCIAPGTGNRPVNLGPVYRIRVTATRC
jgi:hypothetical protein